MNQDQFLEALWTDVIDVDHVQRGPVEAGTIAGDLRRVTRCVRYEAVFNWCVAFDEAGLTPAQWLLPSNHWRWKGAFDDGALGAYETLTFHESRPPQGPDDPFADASEALRRLSTAGVPEEEICGVVRRACQDALEGVRTALRDRAFGPDDLAGLHESLSIPEPNDPQGSPGTRSAGSEAHLAEAGGSGASPILRLRRSHHLAFSPDGARIVAAQGGVITEVISGEALATCRLLANTGHVAWSPDGRWIAATSTSGKIALCDALTGARKFVLGMTEEGAGAVFSRDGARVYAGDWGGFVFAWDVASGREVGRLEVPGAMVTKIRLAPEGDTLDVVANDRPGPTFLLRLPGTLDAIRRRTDLPDRTSDVLWEPDERRAILVGYGWFGRMDRGGTVTDRRDMPEANGLGGSPDGRWYAVTHAGGFRIGPTQDLTKGIEVALPFPSGGAAFSSDSRRVALATWRGGEVWDLGELFRT